MISDLLEGIVFFIKLVFALIFLAIIVCVIILLAPIALLEKTCESLRKI
jgi:hypothetical protein